MTALNRRRLVGPAVTVVVVAAIAAGLHVMGSPQEARRLRLDDRRVEDLQNARGAINRYWAARGHLPLSLDSVAFAAPGLADSGDSTAGEPTAYHTASDSTYELCAHFSRPSPAGRHPSVDDAWVHPAGRHCFTFVAGRPSL